jgi:hypothetical protein
MLEQTSDGRAESGNWKREGDGTVDMLVLEASEETRAGSIPAPRTTLI